MRNSNGKRVLTITKIRDFDRDPVDGLWSGIEGHGGTCARRSGTNAVVAPVGEYPLSSGFAAVVWGLLRERGGRRLLAAWKGVVLVKARISEQLDNALRDKVHLYCVYLVICAILAHTARWTGKGAGPTGVCTATAVDLP